MTEELLKQADDEVAVLLDASEAFDMLNIEPKTGKRLAELIKALADELREVKSVVKEACDYLDTNELTTIGSTSALHIKFKSVVKPPKEQE